jgi:DNA-binding Xre family transcriptional regulator
VKELSNEVGVSMATISNINSREEKISLHSIVIAQLTEALDVDITRDACTY